MVKETKARGVHRNGEELRVNPHVGEFGGFQPQEPARSIEGPIYWEVMRHMKTMGLEPFKENATLQEAGLAREEKSSKTTQPRSAKTSETQRELGEPFASSHCSKCHRYHFGNCLTCT
ncbi:unnamed protein product [Cochlearia groenlandica]